MIRIMCCHVGHLRGGAATLQAMLPQDVYRTHSSCTTQILWERGLPAKRPDLLAHQADLAMINPVSLAASSRIATNFDVGVWLPSPVLSNGTNGFTSG